eukprot:jgi/Psemu1/11609/gm1.11609_g
MRVDGSKATQGNPRQPNPFLTITQSDTIHHNCQLSGRTEPIPSNSIDPIRIRIRSAVSVSVAVAVAVSHRDPPPPVSSTPMSSSFPGRSARVAFAIVLPPDVASHRSNSESNSESDADSEQELGLDDSDSGSDGDGTYDDMPPSNDGSNNIDSGSNNSSSDGSSSNDEHGVPRRINGPVHAAVVAGQDDDDADADVDTHADTHADSAPVCGPLPVSPVEEDGENPRSPSVVDDGDDDSDEDYVEEDDDDGNSDEIFDEDFFVDYASDVSEEEVIENVMMFHLRRMMEDLPNYDSDSSDDEPRGNANDNEENNNNHNHSFNSNGTSTGTNDNHHDNNYDNNYDDDDASDQSPCNCPRCIVDRIVGRCSRCDGSGFGNGGVCDSDSHGNDESDSDSEAPLDPSASPCAICMEPETASRRFAHLPCCSRGTGTEASSSTSSSTSGAVVTDTSSTRFCQKCLVTYLIKNGCGVPRSPTNADANTNTKSNRGTAEAQLAGECPRCKKILVLEEVDGGHKVDEAGGTTTHRSDTRARTLPYHKRTVAATPSAEAMFWYIARGNPGAGSGTGIVGIRHFRVSLVTLANCPNPSYVPEELLLDNAGSPERIRLLCQWGLISRASAPASASAPARGLVAEARSKLAAVTGQWLWMWKWQWLWKWSASCRAAIIERSRIAWLIDALDKHRESLSNRLGTVYQIDPLLQRNLCVLVAKYLHCKTPDDHRYGYPDIDNDVDNGNGSGSDERSVVCLRSPYDRHSPDDNATDDDEADLPGASRRLTGRSVPAVPRRDPGAVGMLPDPAVGSVAGPSATRFVAFERLLALAFALAMVRRRRTEPAGGGAGGEDRGSDLLDRCVPGVVCRAVPLGGELDRTASIFTSTSGTRCGCSVVERLRARRGNEARDRHRNPRRVCGLEGLFRSRVLVRQVSEEVIERVKETKVPLGRGTRNRVRLL